MGSEGVLCAEEGRGEARLMMHQRKGNRERERFSEGEIICGDEQNKKSFKTELW